jgi:dual-specificity kinase
VAAILLPSKYLSFRIFVYLLTFTRYFKRLKLDYPANETTRGSRRFVKAMKHLDHIIPGNNTFLKNFVDLLKRIFVYDPAHRITAKQALQHPWLKEMAQPDDGTEAAKIRQERIRLEQRNQYVRS